MSSRRVSSRAPKSREFRLCANWPELTSEVQLMAVSKRRRGHSENPPTSVLRTCGIRSREGRVGERALPATSSDKSSTPVCINQPSLHLLCSCPPAGTLFDSGRLLHLHWAFASLSGLLQCRACIKGMLMSTASHHSIKVHVTPYFHLRQAHMNAQQV